MQSRPCIKINLNKNDKPRIIPLVTLSNSSSGEDETNDNYIRKVNKDLIQINNDTSKVIEEEINNNEQFIYDYDEIYDDIQKKKEEKYKTKQQSKEPKYMRDMIKTSKRNKIETIRMKEKVNREKLKRENGNDDVSVFLTKNYRKVLDELETKLVSNENEEKDTINNKEFGMMGFYSHLLTKNKLYSNDGVIKDDNQRVKVTDDDIFRTYNNKRKEYERTLPQISKDSILKNININIKTSRCKTNTSTITLNKAEDYLFRYLQRKKDRENKEG